MKITKITLLLTLSFLLLACGRSKEAQFYLLNPLPPQKQNGQPYRYLQIGIDEINIPPYTEKPQLMIHCTPHRLELEEYHQWAEALDKNITRVVETNLSNLLPGAIVESSPWNSRFKPGYHLQIDISQLDIDVHGYSSLAAEYLIYHEDELVKKGTVYYHTKVPVVNIESLVISVNTNLSCLTQEIARVFARMSIKDK
ncbi:Protein of uncharacterised function (DUF330) [Legionella lansingensis]|uniref:ABC-type transport auxiliary lipoprotein component domain-containing protein n=1 Tax=Legionella lansingensis TaxID=45067 RepID=A0A0W0VKJ1_9GAMM|nr:PqiC family protein [Legionella lansingensis]KTD20579.1 hypothetical protein Llan_1832 [Legionella lansingensis]SNV47858.1 Protein of uncharacterised function (DUF330) [Legionella lansingensis]